MEPALESRQAAITILNAARKAEGLQFTVELSKDLERDFNTVGAGVDLDTVMRDGEAEITQIMLDSVVANGTYSNLTNILHGVPIAIQKATSWKVKTGCLPTKRMYTIIPKLSMTTSRIHLKRTLDPKRT